MVAYAQQSFEPLHKIGADLKGGVNYSSPPSKIGDNQFAELLNLQYYVGILRCDTGYGTLNQAVRGKPQRVYQFIRTTGITQQVLITQSTVYVNNSGEWQYVGDAVANTTLTAPTFAGSNAFNVAAMNFVANDFVGIILDNGTQLRTKVTSTGAGIITTQDTVPAGRTANNGAIVVRAAVLNGSDLFQVSPLTWAPLNLMIFTNGVDPIKFFDGVNVGNLPGWIATVQSCRAIVAFHGFLIALDTTEGGMQFPQRVRTSDQGNPEVIVGGLSNFVDLIDTEDVILNALLLGPWLIIYRQNSVMRRSYIGDPLQLFFDEYMIESSEVFSVGLIAHGAVCSVGASHVFVSLSGIFRYTGGYDAESVGDNIYDRLLGPSGSFNTAAAATTFMMYVAELDEVWLFIPTGTSAFPNSVYRYDQGDDSWWPRTFAETFVAADRITTLAAQKTWNVANYAWSTDISPWVSRAGAAGAGLIALSDPIALQVWLYNYTSPTDGGVPIKFSATTKDYEVINKKVRFDGCYAKGTGNNILVELSYDRGKTWQTIGTLNFGNPFTQQNVNKQLSVDSFRLRLSGNDPTFSLDWYRVDYYEETPW